MNKMKFRTKLWLLLILTLLLVSLVGLAVGKYMTTVTKEGQFTVSAELATSLVVQESQVRRLANGKYEPLNGTTTESITYTLMPGVDIPKDPHVVITGKTPIPACLYITVTDSTNGAITYSLKPHWKGTETAGTYVYCADGTTPTEITSDMTVHILNDNLIHVSHTLRGHTNEPGALAFSATLTEVVKTQNSN